ncbi:MAG: HAD-IC family P-type ATPase, partial [Chitinophagaceae bacterium]|nr:HAD-IC family P-type ATPase [Chitinophagaceae bacterium]
QSILTGEADEISKSTETLKEDLEMAQRRNILFSGTLFIYGQCIAVVIKTGENTELGTIKKEVEEAVKDTKEEVSPLKAQLNEFGDFLAKAIGVICLIIWLISFPKFFDEVHGGFILGALYYFKQAVALGVAAIPEGLPAVITTCLSLGTKRMVKKKALVVKLTKVETLGCTTVICSDKTGTLTRNEMFASNFYIYDGSNSLKQSVAKGKGYSPNGDVFLESSLALQGANVKALALNCLLNTESKIIGGEDNYTCIGLPTEGALMSLGKKLQSKLVFVEEHYDRLFTVSFTSIRKMMSVLVRDKKTKTNTLLIKGGAEVIVEKCASFLNNKGEMKTFDKAEREKVLKEIRRIASEGFRVLGLAYKENKDLGPASQLLSADDIMNPGFKYLKDSNNHDQLESDAVFIGMVAISDPVRPEVKGALEIARNAGIGVFMITGDIPETALAIAKDLGMVPQSVPLYDPNLPFHHEDRWIYTPKEFTQLSKAEKTVLFSSAVRAGRSIIFARTTPKHKRSIVKALTQLGEVVAMTGDGVNDAPALKQASIGIAMGLVGTEVAREASDLILLDDNFATIVSAIEEGRAIYANMKAFIRYMISSNIGEVVSIFLSSILGIPEGFNSIQLLWVNLVTDGLPATALSFNPPDKNIMSLAPRKKTDRIVNEWTFIRYVVIGTYVGIATVGIFIVYYTCYQSPSTPHTLVSFWELSHWTKCNEWTSANFIGYEVDPCAYFVAGKRKASTLSLTVLVIIEMFNSLNALSENASLLEIGVFSNPWLLQAICVSVLLHCLIIYIPSLNGLFGTEALDLKDWLLVILFSFPVVIIEEFLKKISRNRHLASKKKI